VHFDISPAGIDAAIRAAQELHDTTVDEVNYKSSLSHKLTGFIEETAGSSKNAKAPSNNNIPFLAQSVQPPPPVLTSHVPRATTLSHPPPAVSYPISNSTAVLMPTQTMTPYPVMNTYPLHPHHHLQPALGVRLAPNPDPFSVNSGMITLAPHYQHSVGPQIDYSRYPVGTFDTSHQHFPPPTVIHAPPPPYPIYQGMGSPGQSMGSPQYFMTPSSISSVDTVYDQMIGNLLLSPAEGPRIVDQFSHYKRSSPVTSSRAPPHGQSHYRVGNNSNPTNNVNLKRVRDKSLRSQFNEFEARDLKDTGNTQSSKTATRHSRSPVKSDRNPSNFREEDER
jgi:hypothetical protein